VNVGDVRAAVSGFAGAMKRFGMKPRTMEPPLEI
jgi:hypothetical protein